MFEDDKHIDKFLQNAAMFASSYFEGSENQCNEFCPDEKGSFREGVVQLKGNRIPKGLVTLESLFDHNDKSVRRTNSHNAYT